MNIKDFQQTLVSSINKHSVTGGAETAPNVDYPVAKIIQKGVDGAYYVVDQAGNILFKVVNTTLSLGAKVADVGIDAAQGAASVVGNTVDSGIKVSRRAILDTSTEAANAVVSGARDIGSAGLKTGYNVVGDAASGVYEAGTGVAKTGLDLARTSVTGLGDVGNNTLSGSQRVVSGVTNDGRRVVGNVFSRTGKLASNATNHAGKIVGSAIGVTTSLAGKTVDFAVTGVHEIVTGVVNIGGHIGNAVIDFGSDASNLVFGTVQDGLDTGVNLGTNVINGASGVGSSGFNTGVQLVNRTGQGAFELGQTGLNTGADLVTHGISGVRGIADTGLNTGSKLVNVGKDGLIQSGELVSSGIHRITDDVQTTGKNIEGEFKGGENMSGVSVLNLNNDSTRMLIPSNFLTSKHVYFVRYQPNGTNMYNYKLNMKGGNVNYLKLRDVNPVWTANNFKDSMPDNVLIQGKQILNNLINDLKTTQFGGFVEQRIADKDDYYNEYKNYKLKYLGLKNNA
jgi:hypothetical protein